MPKQNSPAFCETDHSPEALMARIRALEAIAPKPVTKEKASKPAAK